MSAIAAWQPLLGARPQVLRDYQSRSIDDLRAELGRLRSINKPRRVLLVSPTGSGKTTIAAAMIESAVRRGGAVIFLAHRRELIDQCSERLYQAGVAHGIVMANHPRSDAGQPVQIASVQTLARRLDALPRSTLIFVDEAHHARAAGYAKILDAYSDVPVIGLSATPWRLDGKGLKELFESVVVAARPRELTAQGHLVPFTGYTFFSPDLKGVKKVGADYNQHALELAVRGSNARAGNIIEKWNEHARGKRTVLFAVSIADSKDLVEKFRAAGATAEHVDGEMPTLERAAVLGRFSRGETTVLCNVNVLTEGWDCPAAEVCILARPTLSTVLYLQMVGRVLRPFPGKAIARIHDHAGCIANPNHGMPDAERDYSLDSDKPKSPPPVITCPRCFCSFEGSRECPSCGFVPMRQVLAGVAGRGAPEERLDAKEIPLEELSAQLKLRLGDEKDYLAQLRSTAAERGYKPAWVGLRFRERYGHWPRGLKLKGVGKQLSDERSA